MALGIELKSIGYSISSLRDSFQILIDSSEADFIKRFEKLIKKYSGERHEYECLFFISWPGDFPDLSGYNIELFKQRPKSLLSEEKKFFDQDIQAQIALVKVSALDIFSARYLAEEKLSSLFAVSKLYQISKTPTIKHSLSLIKLGTAVKCIGPDILRIKYIRDAKKPFKSISDFAKLLSNLSSSDAGQLTASLQYHKLSLSAPTDEARLVNLWIALESLIQEGGKSIINRICTYVPTSNTTVYISQIMFALPIDIRKLWRASNTKSLRSLLVKSSAHILHPSDMLSILLDDEKGKLISKFLKFSSDHTLLIFRIFRLWRNLLGSPKILSDMLENHKKNIEWQIRRIYRVRNKIMHQGSCPFETRQLIQHLHSYFIITIHNLVHDLRTNSNWSICDAFEHRLLMYEHFQKRLKEYKNNPISAESLLDFSLTLSTKSCQPAWSNLRYPINLPSS